MLDAFRTSDVFERPTLRGCQLRVTLGRVKTLRILTLPYQKTNPVGVIWGGWRWRRNCVACKAILRRVIWGGKRRRRGIAWRVKRFWGGLFAAESVGREELREICIEFVRIICDANCGGWEVRFGVWGLLGARREDWWGYFRREALDSVAWRKKPKFDELTNGEHEWKSDLND